MQPVVVLPGVYRLTYADWLGFPDDGRLYEIIHGELFMTPPPSIAHQRISRDLQFVLLKFLRERDAGEVFDAPVGVRLGDEDVVEPDLAIVLKAHADRVGKQVIDGPPDIIVEVLSPGTAQRDLGIKREKYRAAGVAEYWIVDPASRAVEVLVLRAADYVRHGLFTRGDRLTSTVLDGFDIDVAEVFASVG